MRLKGSTTKPPSPWTSCSNILTAKAHPHARARRAIEDIDLIWQEGSIERRHYFQIKKPREDNQGNLKPRHWTLVEAVDELLPNTTRNLRGNAFEQTWILGDIVADDLQALLGAGADAPARAAEI